MFGVVSKEKRDDVSKDNGSAVRLWVLLRVQLESCTYVLRYGDDIGWILVA